jgi:hypothetical protein
VTKKLDDKFLSFIKRFLLIVFPSLFAQLFVARYSISFCLDKVVPFFVARKKKFVAKKVEKDLQIKFYAS